MRILHKHLSPLRSRHAATLKQLAALREEVERIFQQFPDLRERPTPKKRRTPAEDASTPAAEPGNKQLAHDKPKPRLRFRG